MTFVGLLTILFIGLKLTNFIAWSWWLVLLPLYGGAVIFGGIVLFTLMLGGSVRRYRRFK